MVHDRKHCDNWDMGDLMSCGAGGKESSEEGCSSSFGFFGCWNMSFTFSFTL